MVNWRFRALILCVVGVQVHEFLGTVGLALVVLSFVPQGMPPKAAWLSWWPLFAFLTWALVAPMLGGQFPTGTGVARLLDWAAIPLIASAASELDGRRWKVLAMAALGTLAASGCVAGFQHVGVWPEEHFFAPWKWAGIPFSRVYEPIGDSGRFMGGGLLFHRLKFGHVSGLAVVGAVVAARRLTGRARVAAIAFGVVGFLSVWLFPYARMAAVAMTLAAGLTAVLVSADPRRALGFSALAALGGFVLLVSIEPLRARFISGLTDEGSGQRTQHLSAGLQAIQQHAWVGVGAGQFRPSKFGGPSMAEHVRENPGKAHNQFVSMAAEAGIPGAIGFVLLLGWLVWRAKGQPLGALTQGAVAHFTILSLAHDPLFQAPLSMALVICIGLGCGKRFRC